MFSIKHSKDGRALMNLGCGLLYLPDWNNIDVDPSALRVRFLDETSTKID